MSEISPSAEGIAPVRRDSFRLSNLARSKFRSRFKLADADRAYIARTGWETLRSQAEKIVRERLAPAAPGNDGRQTPMRGNPVFIAQHATATCCRRSACGTRWTGGSASGSGCRRSARWSAAPSARTPFDATQPRRAPIWNTAAERDMMGPRPHDVSRPPWNRAPIPRRLRSREPNSQNTTAWPPERTRPRSLSRSRSIRPCRNPGTTPTRSFRRAAGRR